jgi:hypothetical protein
VHRQRLEEHLYEGKHEHACSCRPALLCPICDLATLLDACFLVASDDLVDSLLPGERAGKLLN